MMFAIEIDFATREVTIGGPNGLMWVQLSTAIVFGLAFSKLITLGLVPSMLALPYKMREKREARRAARERQRDIGFMPQPKPVPLGQAAE
jgi:multidrug efflux pump